MAAARVAMALVVAVLVTCGSGLAVANLVPAVYVFGDSTVDVGNNGPMPPPYGIDLPPELRPTGRASNGYNVADFISRHMGFKKSPPAYLSLRPETSSRILKGLGGVSYASGGSAILNATRMGNKSISMAEQVEFFAATKSQMILHARGKGGGGSIAHVEKLLSKSLFLISSGGNDCAMYIPNPAATRQPTFHDHLLSSYTKHIQALYDLGARRFGIIDVQPVGCLPLLRAMTPNGGCFVDANMVANNFNSLVGEMMANLAADPQRPGITYSVGSSYKLITNFAADPEAAGFSDVASACCGDGRLGVESSCLPNATVCGNRANHLYWDFLHLTQATAKKGAAIIFDGPVELGFAAPINFEQLVSSTHHGFVGSSTS